MVVVEFDDDVEFVEFVLVLVSNSQAVEPVFVTYPEGHELIQALLCNKPGEVQAVHVVLLIVQVDHPP